MPSQFRRELIINFAVIGGSVVVFVLTLFFLSQDLISQGAKVVKDRDLINQRAAILGALADLKRDAPVADTYKTAMDKLLVSQDQLLDFPRWLDGLARVRKITMTFVFQGAQVPPSETNAGYIAFSLDISGGPGDLVGFLNDIERRSTRFLVSLDGIDLTRIDSGYRILSQGRVFFR